MRKEFKPSYKFVKQVNLHNNFDTTKVVIYSDACDLTELLSDLLDFIKACGYSVKPGASLEVVDNE